MGKDSHSGKRDIKETEKNSIAILPVRLLFPLFRVFNFLNVKFQQTSAQIKFRSPRLMERNSCTQVHQLLRWSSEIYLNNYASFK